LLLELRHKALELLDNLIASHKWPRLGPTVRRCEATLGVKEGREALHILATTQRADSSTTSTFSRDIARAVSRDAEGFSSGTSSAPSRKTNTQ
jgi:hypothetical protein